MKLIDNDYLERQGFDGRKEALRKVERWEKQTCFPVMFYRVNDLVHSTQVLWMLNEVKGYAISNLPAFDIKFASIYALVHDDAEILTGDVLGMKKSRMSIEELRNYEKREIEAIKTLCARWPKYIDGFSYNDLLMQAILKNRPETQLVSYLDKQTSLFEAWHEIFAGNKRFYQGFDGHKPPTRGTDIGKLREKYVLIKPVLSCSHPFLSPFIAPDAEKHLAKGKPHTIDSIRIHRRFPHYDAWIEMILKRGGEQGLAWLIERRES